MLDNQLLLGPSGSEVTYERRFDSENKSIFSVPGQAPDAAKTFTVSHQDTAAGQRSMMSVDWNVVHPTTGEVKVARMYAVLQRPSFVSDATMISINEALSSFLAGSLIASILNREV